MKTTASCLALFVTSTSALSASFLEGLGSGISQVSGGGVSGYLDTLPSDAAAPTAGGGLSGYLDSFSAPPTAPVAAEVPPPATSAVAGVPPPAEPYTSVAIDTSLSGPGVPSYTALLAVGASTSGSGVPSHVDLLAVGSPVSGGGVPSYTELLASNSATTSGPGIGSYTDALGVPVPTGEVAAPGIPATSKVSTPATFLGGIYDMILGLDPDEVKGVGGRLDKAGDDLTFAVGGSTDDESYAMSFIRRG